MDPEKALRVAQGRRLEAARKSAGFRSRRSAALECGWPTSTYSAHERGERTIGQDDAERYARRFRAEGVSITAREILFGRARDPREDQSDEIIRIPRLSLVAASKLADVGDVPEAADAPSIAVTDLPQGDWFALRVEGDSMDRIAPDGSIILVDRRDRRLIPEKFYVFARRGEATFKQYYDGLLLPYSHNPRHKPIKVGADFTVVGRVHRVLINL
jgi:SOS-response transcriptional repressor LexA